MREIVLDTETTGLDPAEGDRVVEIGALELFHRVPTGESWHSYINPERDMPADAYRVHELSEEFLSDKPRFAEIAGGFLEFIADAPLVIHNAPFDAGFLNAEFARLGLPPLAGERLVDTLQMARKRFAGARTAWMHSAHGSRSTGRPARCMARWSIAACWRRSICT